MYPGPSDAAAIAAERGWPRPEPVPRTLGARARTIASHVGGIKSAEPHVLRGHPDRGKRLGGSSVPSVVRRFPARLLAIFTLRNAIGRAAPGGIRSPRD